MNRVDRLLISAKEMAGYDGKRLVLAMVERHGARWTAAAHLWDGVHGHFPTMRSTDHATLEAAVEHIQAVARQYPNSWDLSVIIDDVGR